MSRPKAGSLRVVSGSARGVRLTTTPGSATRPTADRVRQAVFNALESRGAVEDAVVFDAFAGSGALAFEALSRGARHATLVEVDPAARRAIATNAEVTGFADRVRVIAGAGERAVAEGRWDLVLLDPPYDYDRWPELFEALCPWLNPDAVVVIESDREVDVEPHLGVIWTRRYGGTVVTFAVPPGAPE